MRRGSTVRLALLALTWGSSFLWIALALPMLSASWLTVARLVLGATALGIVCKVRSYVLPTTWKAWAHLAVAGLLANVLPYFLFAVGEKLTSSAYAGILNGTTPLWTAVTVVVVSRAMPRKMRAAGLLIGFIGTVLVFEPWRQGGAGALPGVLACLAAAALYGVSYVYLARYVTPLPYNPIALATGQLMAAAVVSCVLLPIDGAQVHQATVSAVVAVVILGVVGTGIAYVLNYALLAREGPTATSLVAYLIPVVAAALGVVVLGDELPPLAGLGAALVLVGVALVRRTPRQPEGSTPRTSPNDPQP